jgi:PAS domain S-box-containing protein
MLLQNAFRTIMRAVYLVFVMVAVLAGACLLGLHAAAETQQQAVEAITSYARQRMLAQRVARLAYVVVVPSFSADQRESQLELGATAAQMASERSNVAPDPVLDDAVRIFLDHAQALSQAPIAVLSLENADFRAIEQGTPMLVIELDRAVGLAEQGMHALLIGQRRIPSVLLLLVLGGLTLGMLLIIHPTARRISRDYRLALEQQQASEQALRESEQRYRSLVASLAEGVVLQHADGSIQACNASAERILGLSAEQIIGRTSVDPHWRTVREDGSAFPGMDHPSMTALRSGRPLIGVTMGVHKPDGSLTWIAVSAQPLIHPGADAPYAVVSSFFDITEQRRVERELRYQKTLLQCLSEASPDGILVVSPERRWLYVNQRFAQMWSLSDEVLAAGTSAVGLAAVMAQVRDGERFRDGIEALYRTPQVSGQAQLQIQDGRSFEYFSAPVSRDGSDYGRVWFYRDISAREAADRAKRDFVSMVSHELRTPLTSIGGALGIVASGAVGKVPQRAHHMIDIAYKNSQRLIRLINDVLDSDRLESEAMPFTLQPLAFAALIAQAEEENQAFAASLAVTLAFARPTEELWVNADPDRLLQVLTNLLANALKFSPKGGVVTVSLSRHESMARFAVTDQGVGIPEAFQPRIFEKFAQADSSDRRRNGGTGLGLNISRAIVERLGGTISYTTGSSGTTFFVDLPLIQVQAPPQALAATSDLQVLICEDDAEVARAIARMSTHAGYATTVVYTAAELREQLARRCFDCLLLDLNLPDCDGETLIAELRADQLTRQLPIVVVSARAADARSQLPAVSGVMWLEKPFVANQLASALRINTRPRILHVEDDSDIVRVVASILSDVADLRASPTLAAARQQLATTTFDAVLLDLTLPDGSGHDLLADLRQLASPPPVIVFSVKDYAVHVPEGVSALLVKSRTSNQQLVRIVTDLLMTRRTARGNADRRGKSDASTT